MSEFIHGGDIYSLQEEVLDFSANINPFGLPKKAKEALEKSMDTWCAYPDPFCRRLTQKLSEKIGVQQERILFSNGAADILYRLVYALKPKNALLLAPAFGEYELALKTVGCNISYHAVYEKDLFVLKEDILKKITLNLDILFLCNPNNPTGQPIQKQLMERIIKRCAEKQVLLAVDECFVDFLENPQEYSVLSQIEKHPNLVILNAFTKLYGLAGLRLGYGIFGDTELLKKTAACAQPWGVSAPAQTAGLAALEDQEYLQKTKKWLPDQREYLASSLRRLGFTIYGSQANYIFFKANNCRELKEKLLEKRILIRACENFRGLDNRFYRAAVRLPAENKKLIEAISEILKD